MTVAFALSGGGARAASQVGVLRALVERGIQPDLVVGASAGAVNGAWYSVFPDGLDDLAGVWLTLTKKGVFPGHVTRHGYNLIRHGYLHSFQAWGRILDAHYSHMRFEDAPIPFVALTVRLSDGQVVAHDNGLITPVLKASTAVPGLFPPQPLADGLHVDGAVIEFLPIPTAIKRGATHIYAIDSSAFPEWDGIEASAMDRCGQLAATAWVDLVVEQAMTKGISVTRLRPPSSRIHDGRDFRDTRRLMDDGYEYALAMLSDTGSGVAAAAR